MPAPVVFRATPDAWRCKPVAYRITFEPLNHIDGVRAKTVEIETAAKAWLEVHSLMESDERVTIVDPDGRPIEWQELMARAAKEAN